MIRPVSLALMAALSLASCQLAPVVAPAALSAAEVPALAVKVAFPAPAKPYRVAASAAELLERATVSLMGLDGQTLATGVTDASGAASLQPGAGFQTTSGTTYVLEAVKGLGAGAPGHRALRLRTLVTFQDGGWRSLSGDASAGPVAIDALTTAVALQSAIAPAEVSAATAMGKVDATVSPSRLAGSPAFSAGTDAAILALRETITSYLAVGLDPVAQPLPQAPVVIGLSALAGKPGDVLTILGSGFSSLPGGNTVRIGPTEVPVLAASASQLVIAVPDGVSTADVSVTTSAGTYNASTFTVTAPVGPTITALSATTVAPGAGLTISGTGFHPTVAKNVVTVNGAEATITGGTTTQLTVTVPAGANEGTGGVVVQTPGSTTAMAALTIERSLDLFAQPLDPTGTAQYLPGYGGTLWPVSFRAPGPGSPGLPSNWDAGDGSDGAFHPTAYTVLDSSKTYQFTSIDIPAGVWVMSSEGRLSIKCQGVARIMGSLDVSRIALPGGELGQDGLGEAPGIYIGRTRSTTPNGKHYTAYGTPDLEQDPLPIGSSGAGSVGGYTGGGAGGSLRLSALGGLLLAGSIRADGGRGRSGAGAGSGGSIFLKTSRLVGSGGRLVSVQGGLNDYGRHYAEPGRIRVDAEFESGMQYETGWLEDTGGYASGPYRSDPGVTFASGPQVLRSAAIDAGGEGRNRVHYLGSTATDDIPTGTTARVTFSDSADGNAWGPWTMDVRQLSRHYVRYQIELSTTDPSQAPVVKALRLRYHR